MPAITCNTFGKGKAYYVATRSNAEFYRTFTGQICQEAGIMPVMDTPESVEVTRRINGNGTFLFILNHDTQSHDITLPLGGKDILTDILYQPGKNITLSAKNVAIIHLP